MSKPKSKTLMVTRVAGQRGQGAKSLYAHGYAEMADILGVPPIEVAEYVADGTLDPLNLVELALARKHGIDQIPLSLHEQAKASRPQSVSDVCTVVPPLVEPPCGLDTLWAYSYSDLADQLGLRSRARIDMTSLRSILDYIGTRHPLLK